MSYLPPEFITLLQDAHTNETAKQQLTDIMCVTSYSSNPFGVYVQLYDNGYYPAVPVSIYVSQSDYDNGCIYCSICGNAILPQYMNPSEISSCYYCVAPTGPIKLISLNSISQNLSGLNLSITNLNTKTDTMQTKEAADFNDQNALITALTSRVTALENALSSLTARISVNESRDQLTNSILKSSGLFSTDWTANTTTAPNLVSHVEAINGVVKNNATVYNTNLLGLSTTKMNATTY